MDSKVLWETINHPVFGFKKKKLKQQVSIVLPFYDQCRKFNCLLLSTSIRLKKEKNREKVKLMVLILERPKERGVGYSDSRRDKKI